MDKGTSVGTPVRKTEIRKEKVTGGRGGRKGKKDCRENTFGGERRERRTETTVSLRRRRSRLRVATNFSATADSVAQTHRPRDLWHWGDALAPTVKNGIPGPSPKNDQGWRRGDGAGPMNELEKKVHRSSGRRGRGDRRALPCLIAGLVSI